MIGWNVFRDPFLAEIAGRWRQIVELDLIRGILIIIALVKEHLPLRALITLLLTKRMKRVLVGFFRRQHKLSMVLHDDLVLWDR